MVMMVVVMMRMMIEIYHAIKNDCSRKQETGLSRALLPQVMGHVFPQAPLSVILTRQ